MEPGSLEGLQLVVDDIEAARDHLADRGLEISDIQDFPWGKFVFFNDPDGNGWAVQQIPDYGEAQPARVRLVEPVQVVTGESRLRSATRTALLRALQKASAEASTTSVWTPCPR